MPPCRIIVCEKNSHFAPAVRRELGQQTQQVVETRSLLGCAAALAESPESLVAIESTPANLELVIAFIGKIRHQYPQATTVALASADSLSASNLLAEAGAIAIFTSVLETPRLAQLAHQKHSQSTPPDLTLQEFINERLPWPALGKIEAPT